MAVRGGLECVAVGGDFSGKLAIVGHTLQKNGENLGLGYLDTFCHGGGWLTALEVEGGQRVWQANEEGLVRG
jgi:serine/threonine protein phosphatase 1